MKMPEGLSQLQEDIVKAVATGKDLAINAGPGVGKTYTLKSIALAFPEKTFLYVVFNKKAGIEAKRSMPSNVVVIRAYQLAYHGLGIGRYRDKLERPPRGYFHNLMRTISDQIKFPIETFGITLNQVTIFIRDVVREFEKSADLQIEPKKRAQRFSLQMAVARCLDLVSLHDLAGLRNDVFDQYRARWGEEPQKYGYKAFEESWEKILKGELRIDSALEDEKLKKYYTAMANHIIAPNTEETDKIAAAVEKMALMIEVYWLYILNLAETPHIEHETYLKLFQLSKPVLMNTNVNPPQKYDAIMYDEFQDAVAVMVAIVMGQDCQKIFVGDPHQGINAFTGAINAIENLSRDYPDVVQLPLTESHRFHPGIAHLVNATLDLKREMHPGSVARDFVIKGIAKETGEVTSRAVLCRTNMGVIEAAVEKMQEGHTVYTGDSIEEEFLKLLADVYFLSRGDMKSIKSTRIATYPSIDEFASEAKLSGDLDGVRAAKIVEKLEDSFPQVFASLASSSNPKLLDGDNPITVMTAHKSKGLGFCEVEPWTDFDKKLYNEDGSKRDKISISELNLLYTMFSRAKQKLILKGQIRSYFVERGVLEPEAEVKADENEAVVSASPQKGAEHAGG